MGTFIRKNRTFFIIAACETAFLVILAICSLHRSYSVSIPASQLVSSQTDKLSYNDGSVSAGLNDTDTGENSSDASVISSGNALILSTEKLNLPCGAYRLNISYDASAPSGSACDQSVGYVDVSSEKYSHRIMCGGISLPINLDSQEQKMWIPLGASVSDLKVNIYFNHTGTLSFHDITLTEITSYRIIRFIGFLILFAVCDFIFLLLYLPAGTFPHRRTILSLTFITLLASLPLMADFLYQGHDLWFHLERITSLAAELSAGHFPARIESTMLGGYGYPFSLFYGDILLYFPAVLYNLNVPLQLCYQLYELMVTVITCVSSYAAFREISGIQTHEGDDTLALTGSLIYTLCSYRLVNAYVRAAVGEYTAMAFIPLVFLGIHRIYSKQKGDSVTAHDYLPLVFGLSFIIESHILTAIIVCMFLVIFFICFIKRSLRPEVISAWCQTVILTICLNIWFLLPFIESMNMKIVATDPDSVNQIQSEGVYPVQLFSLIFMNITGNTSSGTKGEMPLSIGPALLIGLILCIAVLSYRKRLKLDRYSSYSSCLYCLISSFIALFLSSSLFPWDSLRSLNYGIARFFCRIQFPWRYLSIASFFLTCVMVFALRYIRSGMGSRLYRYALAAVIASSVIYSLQFFGSYISTADEGRCYSSLDAGTGDIMGQEYLLRDTSYDLLSNTGIIVNSAGISASKLIHKNDSYIFSCSENSQIASSVDLPLNAYDNYHAYIKDTHTELSVTSGYNNRLRILIPAGLDDIIEVKYVEPASWRYAELISLITLLALLVHSLLTKYRENVNELNTLP